MKADWRDSLALVLGLLVLSDCGSSTPAGSLDYEPSRLPVGELTLGVWLPAGLGEFRFSPADQERLTRLGINQLEWVQRAVLDSVTAEEMAIAFCNRAGLRLPVYYEPRGFSPYDKLHNWALAKVGPGFDAEVGARVRRLREQWADSPGFGGYLIGHEDYREEFYPALRRVAEILKQEDPERPAIVVGQIEEYPAVEEFLEAFFAEGGVPNVFQHEQYVFRAGLPFEGKALQRQLADLARGYDQVARALQGRYGRWQGIVQAHGESRDGRLFYRRPSAAELSVQVGLALSRGAAGIIYFLYSSGPETVLDEAGRKVQTRYYEGLVDAAGIPTPTYAAVQRLNARLQQLSPILAGLYFHGGFSQRQQPDNPLVRRADSDLEFGLFGNGVQATHLLVVNGRPTEDRTVHLEVEGEVGRDAVTGERLEIGEGRLELFLEAGEFRLLEIAPVDRSRG